MNRIFTIAIGLLFIIGVGGFLWFLTPNAQVPTEELTSEKATSVYENADHGFSVSYPSNLDVLEYTPDMATIGRPIEGGIEGVADVRVQIVEGEPGESFTDAAIRDLRYLCDADGPDSSFSCTGLDRAVPFVTKTGTPGFEIYLKGELKDLTSGSVTEVRKGPYFAFALSTGSTATKVLIVHAPLNQTAAEADAGTIKSIASSLVLR